MRKQSQILADISNSTNHANLITNELASAVGSKPGVFASLLFGYLSCPAFSQFDWPIVKQDSAILPSGSAAEQN